MTKHPDNHWWCKQHDRPHPIPSRHERDRAVADGHVTLEHVMQRLKNIVDHAFDNENSVGFDEDGFVVSLTAASLALDNGVKLYVYSNDHPPPHVHVKVRSHPHVRIRISLETGDFLDDLPRDFPSKKLKRLCSAVRENRSVLAGWWMIYQGQPVVLS